MAFKIADRVFETSTTQGTGALNLEGAVSGFQSFLVGIGDGNETYYVIDDGANWEVGIGTISAGSPDTLSRDTILESSNSDAAVNWGSGTRNVRLSIPAEGWPTLKSDNTWEGGQTFSGSVTLPQATIDGILTQATFKLPIGSIYMNASDSTNPETLLGYGTWVAIGVDRVLIGVGSTYPTAGATGGSLTQTFTSSNNGPHTHPLRENNAAGASANGNYSAYSGSIATFNLTLSQSVASSGSGSAFSIVQPYEVVYMWKRTA